MKKYILLFNFDSDSSDGVYDRETLTDIQKFIGDDNCLFRDYSFYVDDPKKSIGGSFWVCESHYVLSWCLANFDELRKGNQFYSVTDFKLERAFEWLDRNKSNPMFTIEREVKKWY